MYEQFYQLSEDPFRLTPDPRYAFAHPSYAKARAYLEYGVQRGEGFIAVTGPPGSGKTTLIEELLTRAPPGVRISHLISSQLEADDLLRMVSHAVGLPGDHASKAMLLNQLHEHLEQDRIHGRRTVLIVDEAQGLNSGALEELRLLTNLADPQGPLLQIILVGQEQLREVLKVEELEQLRQRMLAAYHLKPMPEADTTAYVAHRLRCADWAGDPVISDMAVRIIHHASGGNPRRINLVCSRLLLHGYVNSKHYLAVPDVRVVLEEMEEEELASWDESLEELMHTEEAREQAEEANLTQAAAASQQEEPIRVVRAGGENRRAGFAEPTYIGPSQAPAEGGEKTPTAAEQAKTEGKAADNGDTAAEGYTPSVTQRAVEAMAAQKSTKEASSAQAQAPKPAADSQPADSQPADHASTSQTADQSSKQPQGEERAAPEPPPAAEPASTASSEAHSPVQGPWTKEPRTEEQPAATTPGVGPGIKDAPTEPPAARQAQGTGPGPRIKGAPVTGARDQQGAAQSAPAQPQAPHEQAGEQAGTSQPPRQGSSFEESLQVRLEPLMEEVRVSQEHDPNTQAQASAAPEPEPGFQGHGHGAPGGNGPAVDGPGGLPNMHVGERLAEPPDHTGRAPVSTGHGWEWVVGGVLVFLLAALVVATHDPTRERVQQWLGDTLTESPPAQPAPSETEPQAGAQPPLSGSEDEPTDGQR